MVESLLKRSEGPCVGKMRCTPTLPCHGIVLAMLERRKVPSEYQNSRTIWCFLDPHFCTSIASFCFGRLVSNSLRELSELWSTPSTALVQLWSCTYPKQWPPLAKSCLFLDVKRYTGSLHQCIYGRRRTCVCLGMSKTAACAQRTSSPSPSVQQLGESSTLSTLLITKHPEAKQVLDVSWLSLQVLKFPSHLIPVRLTYSMSH